LFDLLGQRLTGQHVLDLYAGTGAVGIEALSRGAERAVFVEIDRRAVLALRGNLARSGFLDRATVVQMEVLRYLRRASAARARFDLIFLDPPYGEPGVATVLAAIGRRGLLAPGGTAVVERSARSEPARPAGQLVHVRAVRHGDAVLDLYRGAAA